MASLPPNIHFLGDVDTTMVSAREYMTKEGGAPFGVVAESQSKGRGTGGRVWTSPKGNLYFTIGIPQSNPLYLQPQLQPVLPLVCGLACRRAMLQVLPAAAANALKTKWPNDIIFHSKKMGGTLVESEGDYFFFGIGLNVNVAPPVTDAGRTSTTLNEVAEEFGVPPTSPQELACRVWECLFAITMDATMTREKVVQEFNEVMDYSLKLHKRVQDGRDPDELTAVSLNSWGHLTVRHGDGTEETLCAEYLF